MGSDGSIWITVLRTLLKLMPLSTQVLSLLLLSTWTVLRSSVARVWGIDIPPDTTISARSKESFNKLQVVSEKKNFLTVSEKKNSSNHFGLTDSFSYWQVWPYDIVGVDHEYITNIKVVGRDIDTKQFLLSRVILVDKMIERWANLK